MVLGYTAFILIAAGAIFLLESPRGGIDIASRGSASDAPDPALARQSPDVRFARSLVAAALGTLNADQRAALVLVDMEGYSVEEAAQILGCAPGTVKSRCARGRARLLPLLSHLKQVEAGS